MTECERIIAEKVVPQEFLNEETRCGFFVDSTRKKIWTIQLDLVRELSRACEKLNIKFFIFAGSLLGAVRHHGFIPWDDDFDVALFRDDYEILLNNSCFESPYFLQTPHTDPNYAFSFTRLVNDNTTFCSKMFSYQGYHAGICIDIFPLDLWDIDRGTNLYSEIKHLNMENSTWMRMKNPHLDEQNKIRVQQWSKIDPLSAYKEINRFAQTFQNEPVDYVANAVTTVYPYGKEVFAKHTFDNAIMSPFENLSLPIPAGYHEILSNTYGDYMSFPPLEIRGTRHKGVIIDPDIPYQVRLKNMD